MNFSTVPLWRSTGARIAAYQRVIRPRSDSGSSGSPSSVDPVRSQNSTVTVFRTAGPGCRAGGGSRSGRWAGACGWRGRRSQVEHGILREDLLVQFPQRGAGLDAEPVDEGRAGSLIRLERLRLPAGAVERQHQLCAEMLAERMRAHERLQLADQLRVASIREIALDPLLDAREAKLLQTGDLGLGEALVGEVRQRLPPPLLERLLRLPAVPQELETAEVELLRLDPQQIPARLRLQAVPAEHLAELGDVDLERLSRRLGRLLVPEGLDQPLVRDHAVRVQGEHGEGGTLFGAAEVERAPVVEHFERAEDAEIHRVCLAATLAPASGDLKALNPAVTGA